MQRFSFCSIHKSSPYQYLIFRESQPKFACPECVYQQKDCFQNINFKNIIPISKIIKQPESFISYLNIDLKCKNFLGAIAKLSCDEIRNEFLQLESKFKQLIDVINSFIIHFKDNIEQTIINLNQLNKDIEEAINYSQFKLLLQESQDVEVNQDAITQVELKIQQYIENLQNSDILDEKLQKVVQKYILAKKNYSTTCVSPTSSNFNEILAESQNLISSITSKMYPPLSILNPEFFDQLFSTITSTSQQNITQIELIYQGSRDGLTAESFWSKVNGVENTLCIFQSKNEGNNIFGGYTPCKWQEELNSYVGDTNVQSFLFSYNHRQIYPLKSDQKGGAIYCSKNYGPTFGNGHDLFINEDFIQGYSKLGQSYQWEGFTCENNEQLFGGKQPNIKECEIYHIIFQ